MEEAKRSLAVRGEEPGGWQWPARGEEHRRRRNRRVPSLFSSCYVAD
jgi:hypothetical protein